MPRAVILTAISVEYLAVRQHLTNLEELVHSDGTIYERGQFAPDWDILIAEIGVDDRAAELETERIIEYFSPNVILSVGLGCGMNTSVAINDVVASTKVYGNESIIIEQPLTRDTYEIESSRELIQRAKAEARKPNWFERTDNSSSISRVFIAPIINYNIAINLYRYNDKKISIPSIYNDVAACDVIGWRFLEAVKRYPQILKMVIRGIVAVSPIDAKTSRDVKILNYPERDITVAVANASAFAFEVLSKFQLPGRTISNLNPHKSSRLPSKNLILSEIELSNIRCFENISIDLEIDRQPNHWTMILGDNAVGKSTLLKSIALGLCNESDAVALIKELPGDFVRKGAESGYIKISLREDKPSKRPKKYTITTKITKQSEDASEIVRQETTPAENFPWSDVFICGYGANRSSQAYTSYEQYKVIDAVRSLFDPQTFLQNPEIILLRQDPVVRSILEEKLQQILMLDPEDYRINYTKRGLEIDGPWGRLPFQVLSDGYRSTTQWVLDFIGWSIHAERLIDNPDIGGILLIDEIEQHLHPRWQRYIVQRLRKQFPKTQIIASTHTPLVAAGIADVDESMLLKLNRDRDNRISVQIVDKQQVAGQPADRVLTSDAFGLVTTRNVRSHDNIDRYTELLGQKTRTAAEETELEELRSIVRDSLSDGETTAAKVVERAVDEALEGIITNVSPEMLDVETKKQLRALFQSEN